MREAERVTTGFIEAEGGPLYYEVAGEGHPLVLIHAGVADNTMWDDQFDVFAQRYKVIRYDTRGFGKSPVGDKDYSNRQELYQLLKRLGVEKAYVMGISRGGQIAVDFTLEHPEMADAVIPVAAGLGGMNHQPNEAEMKLFTEMEEAEEKRDFARVAELDVRVWADGPEQPEGRADSRVRERMRQMCLSNYSLPEGTGQPKVLDPPAIDRLGEINVPALVIVGDLDVSSELVAADLLAEGIAGAKKVVIQGTAHMVSMEKPEEFNRIVLDFLGKL